MSNFPKVCAISGGTSGVGLATALKLVEQGCQVSICGRDADRLKVAELKLIEAASAEHVHVVTADMSKADDARRFVAKTIERFSSLDLLMNNAAMAPLAPIDEMDDATIDSCIDLNIRGVYYATRSAWSQMKKQGRGVIINISSQAAIDPFPGFSMYGSTKAWIELFTVALAGEGKEHGIRAYGIRPGAIETPMLRGLFSDFPADQCVSPEEIADAALALCGDAFASSSGQIVKVSRQ